MHTFLNDSGYILNGQRGDTKEQLVSKSGIVLISRVLAHSSFSIFQFVKFVNLIEILVFFFNKYRYKLCTCVNFEIYTCTYN